MPQLKSTKGARDVFLPDDSPRVQEMVGSGDWRIADGDTASIVDPYGHQTVVSQDIIAKDQDRGVANTIEDQASVVKRAREKRLEGETSTLGALGRSAASAATFGLTDAFADDETLEADQLHHRTASLIGTGVGLGATLLLGNDLGLGKLIGGEAASTVSAGARELAATNDALTAEHVGASLSSKALLAGEASNATERALMRAGGSLRESTAARTALETVPEDLANADAAGLKRAAAEERASIRAQADAEKASLEELRKPQREELANQIRDMHHELTSERPIFQAVVGDDVRAVAGVKDIASQLNKSYRGLRSTLDNPIRVAENPDVVLGHLQMRQTALESLQVKAPEIQAVLGNDARAAALEHVDGALEQTKQQIAAIKQLSARTPVSGARLTDLQAGVTPRLTAIEAAQEALTKAPELGLVGKGVKAGVFAAGTALAHAIPGVGIMAPFAGKWAGEAIGKVFERLAAGKAAQTARSTGALEAFLGAAKTSAPAAAVTATQVLRAARFGSGPGATGNTLPELFKARSAELRGQTMIDPATRQIVMRPEARQAVADKLAPIAQVNPLLADKLETIAARKAAFMSQMIPRQPDVGGLQIGPDTWQPSELAMRSWARTIRAVEDPGGVEERLAHGTVTPEDATAYRSVFPERFAAMQAAIYQAAPTLAKTLPLKRKVALSIFTGVPLIPALQPNVLQVLQGNFVVDPGTKGGTQAPAPTPSFGALGSLKSVDKPTKAQQREG